MPAPSSAFGFVPGAVLFHCRPPARAYDAAELSWQQAAGSKNKNGNGQALGFEATLWATADKLRGNLDAAEYKHVVLAGGLQTKGSHFPSTPSAPCATGRLLNGIAFP